MHGLRGLRSNRSLPAQTQERVLAMARDPDYADLGPTLLAEQVELDLDLPLSVETVRAWLMGAGLWTRRRQRAKHRSGSVHG